jgi:hypothetical protein
VSGPHPRKLAVGEAASAGKTSGSTNCEPTGSTYRTRVRSGSKDEEGSLNQYGDIGPV